MHTLRTAVIGVGYLGKYHAEKFKHLPQSELVAVCDVDFERCNKIAKELNVSAVIDYRSLIGLVDAVSIAVPTSLHHKIGKYFLQHGIHVLLEKPIAASIAEADDLIHLAKTHHAILQIGHLERFNPVIKAAESTLHNPRFIESLRLAPFQLRGSEINVVLDLMIHDIDIIQSIVHANISRISANGASVLSSFIDIANARIEFENGCVANVTASRVSLKVERKLRIFQPDAYIGMDLNQKIISIHRKSTQEIFPGIPGIDNEEKVVEKGDALREEIKSFLNAVIHHQKPEVSGEDGKKALATAIAITKIVHESNEALPTLHFAET